jgi:CheY-like chemotaxis protein
MSDKTILLVEDNEIQREGAALVLRREGYTVHAAADGREALALVNGGVAPDLLLLDMTMPPPDGWRILALRKKNPALASVPVVILTGLGVAHEEWAASLGACALIRKPVETAELLAEVRRCLGEGQG